MRANDVEKQSEKTSGKSTPMKRLRWVLIFGALVVLIGGLASLWWISRGTDSSNEQSGTFTVRRGDLHITVTESGDIEAIDSIDIKSEVEGRTTIISIVDEGTIIAPEDVNNKVLVELDSSNIKEKLTQQEIKFLSAEASYTDANESLDIRKKQNDSDIKAGQMKVRFALMDFKKYLGEAVAGKLIEDAVNASNRPIDITSLLEDTNSLGGSASHQKLKELKDNISLAEEEFLQAQDTLMWTRKLYEKEYVSQTDLERDKLKVQTLEFKKERAEIALELFKRYDFPKEVEKLLSDYTEAGHELERTYARCRSKLAQAQAKLESAEATYSLQKELLEKWRKQLEACTIKAPAPGQVVYSSSMMDRWERRRYPIEVGAEIRERQKIISIPDTSRMKIEIKIHEMWVDKVQPGQKAKITITAFPDKIFTGKVLKKAPLAAPEEWLNPDLKVYATDVSIDGTHDFIKTGMSAKVEVTIDELKDVISVPIQAVLNIRGKKVCFVLNRSAPEQRQVETGAFNDSFVEIKSGLTEGQKVLLNPPRLIDSENKNK